jgi:hypothetical protein
MPHGRHRPDDDRQREPPARADPVVKLSRQPLAERVRHEKADGDPRELRIRQSELLADHRPENGDREPVDEVNERGEEDQTDDPPAQPPHGVSPLSCALERFDHADRIVTQRLDVPNGGQLCTIRHPARRRVEHRRKKR